MTTSSTPNSTASTSRFRVSTKLSRAEVDRALEEFAARKLEWEQRLEKIRKDRERWRSGRRQTYAQELNWLYGGAQGRISHSHQALKAVYEGLTVRNPRQLSQVQRAGLQYKYRALMQALGDFAREVDMYYQSEKFHNQAQKKPAKEKANEPR